MKKLFFKNGLTIILTGLLFVLFIASIFLIIYGLYKDCACCINLSSSFMGIINIMIVILLTYTELMADDARIKFSLACDVYARHKDTILSLYANLMDSPSQNNQLQYDLFKNEICGYFYDLIIMDSQWKSQESNLWWQSKFDEIDRHYVTCPDYDFCDVSREWSKQIQNMLENIYKVYSV